MRTQPALRDRAPEQIVLQAPPGVAKGGGSQSWMQMMFMVPMMLGMGAMSFVYIGRSGGPMTYIFGGLFVVVMIGMITMSVAGGRQSAKAKINEERRDYQRYLAGLRKQVRETAEAQRAALLFTQPEPEDLWTIVPTQRRWERRRTDAHFGQVRIGLGPQQLATPLRAPQTAPLEDLDPVASTSLRHFIRTYSTVPDLPVAIALRGYARITISGARDEVAELARAVIGQAVTFHSPADLRVALCVAERNRADWDWAKWLPHAQDESESDAAGPVRLAAGDIAALVELLGPDFTERPAFTKNAKPDAERPHLLVISDGSPVPQEAERHGTTVLELTELPPDAVRPNALFLHVSDGLMGMLVGSDEEVGFRYVGEPDQLSTTSAEALARTMAPWHTPGSAAAETPMSTTFGLADLLGLGDPRDTDPAVTWRPRSARERLRVPLGLDPDGLPVEIDLKESAEGGMGPHGLVIGATGSGKSELLRTLVTGLAVTHSSEALNLALIDFKGGATFAGMSELPHTCAVITNLSDDLALVDRMADAIHGELVRRQELLRTAGNYASVRDYEQAREAGADLAPLPALLVIIDEFSELLSSRPEFIDLFVMIGRLGRSLSVHLLLASQRLEEGRLRGLDAHLSYRIGLRTFSASESRTVLGVPDAYHLPAVPGSAYLKSDTDTLQRLKAAYVSGELPARSAAGAVPESAPGRQVIPFGLDRAEDPAPPVVWPAQLPEAEPEENTGETIMSAMVDRLVGRGPDAHRIWLPPLDEPPTLDQLLPALGLDPERGLCPVGWSGNGGLAVPVATVDKPFEQRRDQLWLDFSGAAGNALLIGAPQSGKSTFLRSTIASLALTHTPAEVQFFLLDMGGGALAAVAGLPHVSGHAARRDEERCRRIVAEATTLLDQREAFFAEHGIDSIQTFRQRRAEFTESGGAGREFGDVFVVVDDWATVRQEFSSLEDPLVRLATRGLGFGIHVIISTTWWLNLPTPLRDSMGTRVELRLGDPSDSMIDRRAAQNVPAAAPGRGLTVDKLHMLTALPRADGDQRPETLAAGTSELVARVCQAWPGAPAPRVRLLPRKVAADELPLPAGRAIPLGLAESDLQPVHLDFATEPHFIAFADVESGKTALLRSIAHGITRQYTPEEARIIAVDYRRGLLGAIGEEHLLGYAGSEPALDDAVAQVAQAMRERLPGPDITPEQLRRRDWWQGRELFLLVDDYELVASPGKVTHPLLPLLDLLPHARDIGLHLVLARGSGGAARAMFDPVVQRIRELGSPGLVMSGSRDEGALLGDVRPGKQPPGRGVLVRRRAANELVQVAWTPFGAGTSAVADDVSSAV
ncbi:DNA segregation ATPase FtsK/SpoIIIE, S-DNA-T family [Saccharopolyspora antimicrobica]|uniref:DNA segregation ATPase FtsK/SpoIIIE, S-DNA-T family n=1 Tax=Saccharopolyspora antimicrobica TaxID=455193 RepID=A0A1I4U612_9PSEU|nr:type VII secretion protein EccCa [Saccharopolyspora antimicrobica]RKT88699.1 S-DNA-T family DNA segregation ATPase FtsK/SpoIIIE [Saccharopolyspora antimicrobica]SFM84379.1 DNA segregation ATPase FtsK/SpoIIIE, S-DNA-T family [Saccharopolyspora antimicrobica]